MPPRSRSPRLAHSPADYFAAPFGAVLARTRFYCTAFEPDIFCLTAWGFIEVSDFVELAEVFDAAAASSHQARRQLVLHEGLRGVSSGALTRFLRFMGSRPDVLDGVRREALSRGPGVAGFVAVGIYSMGVFPFAARAFDERAAALHWLREAPGEADRVAAIVHDLEAFDARFGPTRDPLLAELLAMFEGGRWNATLAECARTFGTSERSLQRRLQRAGTSFERVRRGAVLMVAKQRLEDSSDTIRDIARELGFASAESFSTSFRQHAGTTPAQWRRSNRAAE